MLKSIIISVIRNPVYIIASLISVIAYRFIPSLLLPLLGISAGIGFGLFREVIILILASVFMAGIGNLLIITISESTSGLGDFLKGIRINFFKLLRFNLLIAIPAFLGGTAIFKPNMIMGLSLPVGIFSYYLTVSLFISPLFVLWYPAILIDNVEIIDGLKKALATGKKSYIKVLLSVFIPLVPFIILAYYYSINIYASEVGINSPVYYFSFGVAFILSLFAIAFIFKIYHFQRLNNNKPHH